MPFWFKFEKVLTIYQIMSMLNRLKTLRVQGISPFDQIGFATVR